MGHTLVSPAILTRPTAPETTTGMRHTTRIGPTAPGRPPTKKAKCNLHSRVSRRVSAAAQDARASAIYIDIYIYIYIHIYGNEIHNTSHIGDTLCVEFGGEET